VDRMVADAGAGAQVDIEEYAAAWLVEHAHTRGATAPHGNRGTGTLDTTAQRPAVGGAARTGTESTALPPTV